MPNPKTDPHEITDDYYWFPFSVVIVMPNVSNTVTTAIRRNDYSLAVLFTSVFVAFILVQFHLSKILSLPQNRKPGQNIRMNFNMWFLHMALPFGCIYQLADFLPPQFTFTVYAVVLLCTSFMFYLFVVDDLVKCWENWRRCQDEHRLPENQTLDSGKLDCYNSCAISEKV